MTTAANIIAKGFNSSLALSTGYQGNRRSAETAIEPEPTAAAGGGGGTVSTQLCHLSTSYPQLLKLVSTAPATVVARQRQLLLRHAAAVTDQRQKRRGGGDDHAVAPVWWCGTCGRRFRRQLALHVHRYNKHGGGAGGIAGLHCGTVGSPTAWAPDAGDISSTVTSGQQSEDTCSADEEPCDVAMSGGECRIVPQHTAAVASELVLNSSSNGTSDSEEHVAPSVAGDSNIRKIPGPSSVDNRHSRNLTSVKEERGKLVSCVKSSSKSAPTSDQLHPAFADQSLLVKHLLGRYHYHQTSDRNDNSLRIERSSHRSDTNSGLQDADDVRSNESIRDESTSTKTSDLAKVEDLARPESSSLLATLLKNSPKTRHPSGDTADLATLSSAASFSCQHCRIEFPDRHLYLLHTNCHTDGDPWRCRVCSELSRNAHEFNRHLFMKPHP